MLLAVRTHCGGGEWVGVVLQIVPVPASTFALGEQCESLPVNLCHRCWLDNKLRYVKHRLSRNAIGWGSLVKAERLAFLALSSFVR
jgi:hypothetical protein